MTREDIIRMARQAGAFADHITWVERDLQPVFERFAALVAEEVRGRTIESEKAGWLYAIDQVVEAEREECAKVCESYQDALDPHKWPNGYDCAAAIRARWEK